MITNRSYTEPQRWRTRVRRFLSRCLFLGVFQSSHAALAPDLLIIKRHLRDFPDRDRNRPSPTHDRGWARGSPSRPPAWSRLGGFMKTRSDVSKVKVSPCVNTYLEKRK